MHNALLQIIYNISNRTRSLPISENILLSPITYPDHMTETTTVIAAVDSNK